MIFNLTCSALEAFKVRVAGFHGSEKISSPYAFDIYFTIDIVDPLLPLEIDLGDTLFSKATLTVALGNELPFAWSGILSSVRLVRAAETAALFHARLVPQVWQLALTKHSRIWTQKSIIDVVTEVLDESGVAHEFRLNESYPVEEHICQYKESNLAFISRWFEREGMYYFFEQTDDGDLLVITDNKATHTTLRTEAVHYTPLNEEQDGAVKQIFDNFTATHNALPASVKVIDYDYARPLLDVTSSVDVEQNAVGELAEYGGRFFSPEDAARLARIRAEDQLVNKRTFYATGGATQLYAGFKFTLDQHPIAQYNAEYLITALEHYGYDSQLGPQWGSLIEKKYSKNPYRVELDAISSDTQFRRGQVTPWPRVDGFENAIVDGPVTSQYAQIDDQGRYKIKFKFDEGTYKDGKASTWVRMAQPHGGTQEGHHFPLRKNVEVICTFLGGDPDRPVISGVVHNQLNQSVVTNNNYTQNIIRTGSLNHIVMEDQSGAMFIDIYCPIFTSTLFLGHGEWNFHLTTMGNGRIHTEVNLQIDVNNKWDVDVVNDVTWAFHNHLGWTVDNNVKIHFGAELDWTTVGRVGVEFQNTFDFHVVGATTIKMDATLDCHVKGNATFLFDANVRSHIRGNLDAKIDGNEKQDVGGNRTRHVGGNEQVDIDGNQTVNIKGSQTVNIDSPYNWIRKADAKQLTYGATTEMFFGLKNSLQVGVFNETTIALKNSLQVGVFNEMTVANKNALTLGSSFEFSGATRTSISAATQLSISAMNVGLTGLNVSYTAMDASKTGLNLLNAGPSIEVTVITIFI